MQKKYESQGFVIVAQHRQGADLKDKCLSLCRSNNVNYMVTQGGSVPGDAGNGIPRCYLFDATGKCVYSGHPSSVDKTLEQVMATTPHWLTGGKSFKNDDVKKAAAKLRGNRGYGKIAEDLAEIADKDEEAKYLHDRIMGYADSLMEKAKAQESEDALACLQTYKMVEVLYKGTKQGDAAKDRAKELKRDKDFKNELKAAKYLAKVEYYAGQIKSNVALDHPANRKPVQAIAAICRKMQKSYPDAAATKKAIAIAEGLRR